MIAKDRNIVEMGDTDPATGLASVSSFPLVQIEGPSSADLDYTW